MHVGFRVEGCRGQFRVQVLGEETRWQRKMWEVVLQTPRPRRVPNSKAASNITWP